MRRIILRILVLVAMIFAICSAPAPTTYAQSTVIKDVYQSSPYAWQSILRLNKLGILSGDKNGYFNPHRPVTRAEIVKMIVLSLGINTKPASTGSNPTFKDVPSNHWAYEYVEAAHRAGIVNGTSPDLFQPDKYCTREEMAVMLVRSLGLTDKQIRSKFGFTFTNRFDDAYSIADWAKPCVEFALRTGLMNGTSKTKFSPKAHALREQAVVIIDRFLANKSFIMQTANVLTEKSSFPDLYLALMENFLHYKGRISSIHTLTIEDKTTARAENIRVEINGVNNMSDYHLHVKILSYKPDSTSVTEYEAIKAGQQHFIKYAGDEKWSVENISVTGSNLAESLDLQKQFLSEYRNFNIEDRGLVYLNGQQVHRYSLGINKEALTALLPNLLMGYDKDFGSFEDIDNTFNEGYSISTNVYITGNNKLFREVHKFTAGINKTYPEYPETTHLSIQCVLDSSYSDIGREFKIEPPPLEQ